MSLRTQNGDLAATRSRLAGMIPTVGRSVALISGMGVIAVLLLGATCWKKLLAEYRQYRLGLYLSVERTETPSRFFVILKNRSTQEYRFWELRNSWGWRSISILLKEGGAGKAEILRRKTRAWTRNFPSFSRIPPGQELKLAIDLRDGTWVVPQSVDLASKSYSVGVQIEIEFSAEAEKHGVFIGILESL